MRWWLLALVLWGCDDGGSAGPAADAAGGDAARPDGVVADAGSVDAGPLTDGAPPADFSIEIDALPADASTTDAGIDPDAAPDAGPDATAGGPAPVVEDAPVPATPERLLRGVTALATAGDLLVAEAEGLVLLDDGAPLRLTGDASGLLGAAALPRDLVVAAGGALYVREGDALLRSPLSDRLPLVTDVAAVRNVLWIATEGGIFRFASGELQTVTPADLPADDARLVVDGTGLWVGAGEAIYRLGGTPLVALPTDNAPAGGEVSVDAAGEVWLVADDQLWWLDETVLWWPVALPFTPRHAAAGPGSAGVWLASDAGLWHLREGRLRRYEGAPVPHLLAVDAAGGALAVDDVALWRVPLGRLVQIEPPPNPLLNPGVARIVPSLPERVAQVTATVDGQDVVVDDGDVALTPFELSRGAHTLEATVVWDDGVRASARVVFDSRVTTWADDVAPLAQARCAMCHGQGAAARPLWASAQWRAIMPQILDAVRTGRMPLAQARLTAAEIELLEVWRALEMPEEWP